MVVTLSPAISGAAMIAPHREMRLRRDKIGREFAVADFQHVRVVPASRPGDVGGTCCSGQFVKSCWRTCCRCRRSSATNCPRRATNIRNASPFCAAKADKNRPPGFHQAVGHAEIIVVRHPRRRQIATVVLQIIRAEFRVSEGVHVFVIVTARVACGGVAPLMQLEQVFVPSSV